MKRSEEMALKAYPDIPLPHLGEGIIAKQGHLRKIYQEGYEQAEKDTIERIREQVWQWMPDKDEDKHTYGERLAFSSILHLLGEMEDEL